MTSIDSILSIILIACFGNLVLGAYVPDNSTCCGPTWIRNTQTSKSDAFATTIPLAVGDSRFYTFRLLNATAQTTVMQFAVDASISLSHIHPNPLTTTTTSPCVEGCSLECCNGCIVGVYWALVIFKDGNTATLNAPNLDQVSSYTAFFQPDNFVPVLSAGQGFINSFASTLHVQFTTVTSLYYNHYFPEGILLNSGDSIALLISSTTEERCTNIAPRLQVQGFDNFIYAYAEKRHKKNPKSDE
jgi:hypothetical protein